jgi:hypothetical protein
VVLVTRQEECDFVIMTTMKNSKLHMRRQNILASRQHKFELGIFFNGDFFFFALSRNFLHEVLATLFLSVAFSWVYGGKYMESVFVTRVRNGILCTNCEL